MKHLLLLFFFSVLKLQAQTDELIFQSGFEKGSRVIPVKNNHDSIEKDHSLPFKNDWVEDLEKDATFKIEYTGGDSTKRYGAIVAEPGHETLHFQRISGFYEIRRQNPANLLGRF